MLIAQFSDTHIKAGRRKAYGVVDTAAALERAVDQLVRMKPLPLTLLLTGDLVDHGSQEDYALLNEILQPWYRTGGRTLPVMGNHDEREAVKQAFSRDTEKLSLSNGEFFQYQTALADDLRLIVLDTVVAGKGHGQLCEQRLQWLEQQLSNNGSPTIIAMHHPPFVCGIEHMDHLGLQGREAFVKLVSRFTHVERILCGHLHRGISLRIGNTVAQCAPSPAHQVTLDLQPDGPDCFSLEPSGFLLHHWQHGSLVSHTVPIGQFEGPYPFRIGGQLLD
jgi:3',5'-cyclic-AMP phosphodiesterase